MIQFRQKEEHIFRSFFQSFKKNFKQSTLLWLLLLLLGLSLVMCFRIAQVQEDSLKTVMTGVLCIPAILLVMVASYSFPLLAQFEVKSCWTLIIDTVMLGIAYFPKTIQIIALNILPIVIIAALPSLVACVLFIWVPIGFSMTALLIENRLEPVFKTLQESHEANHNHA